MSISTPVRVAADSTNIASGTASPASTVAVQVGSLVFVNLNTSSSNNDSMASLIDSAGNAYKIAQPPPQSGQAGNAIAWTITTQPLPIGSTFTGASVSGGLYSFRGAFYSTGVGFLDKTVLFSQSAGTTSATLTTDPVLNSANELAAAYLFVAGSGTTITPDATFTSLFNNTLNDIGYKLQSGSTAGITYHPTWLASVGFTAVLLTFAAQAPPVSGFAASEW